MTVENQNGRGIQYSRVNRNTCIGIVDSQPRWLHLMGNLVEEAGYKVARATDGPGALSLVETDHPDLLLLGDPLTGIDTYSVLTRIREFSWLPIIVVGTKDHPDYLTRMLEIAGADNYMVKGGFGDKELVARVGALMRRVNVTQEGQMQPIIQNGELMVDRTQHLVTLKGEEVPLTPTEFNLLAYLAQNRGRTVVGEDILSRVWGSGYYGDYNDLHALYVHVCHLRGKLEEDPKNPRYIVTKRSVGYKMPNLNDPAHQSV